MDGLEEKRMGSRRAELVAPCKGCGARKPGCHDKCQAFQGFRVRLEEKRKYEKANEHNVIDPPMKRWRWN